MTNNKPKNSSMPSCYKLSVISHRLEKGFSLLEIFIVIGITSIIAVAGLGGYLSLRNSKSLENMANRVAADITYTAERSKAQESGFQWWMNFQNSGSVYFYLICKGDTYSAGGCGSGTQVKRVQATSGLSLSLSSGSLPRDLIFQKSTGLPVDSSGTQITSPITITVSSSAGVGPKTITINKNGRVDY